MTDTQKKLSQLGLSHAIYLSDIIGPISANSNLNSYLVGGVVRDALLNRPSKDFDICVSGNPEKMKELGEWVYSQLSTKMKNKYSLVLRDQFTGLSNLNLRDFLQNCGGGVLVAFLLYLSGKTDFPPIIYPRFLVAMTKINGEDVEFVATRSEDYSVKENGQNSRKRNPGKVSISDEYEDAIRRDFTINALYVNLSNGDLLDPTNKGINDIKNKTIRVTRDANPELVFLEDPLRILRAIRQSTQLGFNIEPETIKVIKKLMENKGNEFFGTEINKEKSASWGGQISAERIRDEFVKILLSQNSSEGLNKLFDFGILDIILPEVSALIYDKNARHKNLWEHTLAVLNNIKITPEIEEAIENTSSKVNIESNVLRQETLLRLKLGALLHDIGKIETRSYGEIICPYCKNKTHIRSLYNPVCDFCKKEIDISSAGSPTFHQHQYASEQLANNILKRFKFSNRMVHLVARDCALHQVQFDNYLGEEVDSSKIGLKPSKIMLAEKLYSNLTDSSYNSSNEWDELNFAVRIYGLIQSDSSANTIEQQNRVKQFISEYERAKKIRQEEKELHDFSKPELTGDEIMEIFNVRPGKWIGNIHKKLIENKLNHPTTHNREKAMQIVQEELDKWGPEIYNIDNDKNE